jgi:hypothetical protein
VTDAGLRHAETGRDVHGTGAAVFLLLDQDLLKVILRSIR